MSLDPYHISLAEFDIKPDCLGSGSYSEIVLIHHKRTNKPYALKVVNKDKAQRHNNVKYFVNERRLMVLLNNYPRIIRLCWTTKDEQHIYFIYEIAEHGEMWEMLRGFRIEDQTVLSTDVTHFEHFSPPENHLLAVTQNNVPPLPIRKIWLSQLLIALEYVNLKHSIAHRDIKPENILLDAQFNIKLADFGTAKLMTKQVLDAEYQQYLQAVALATQRVDLADRQRQSMGVPSFQGKDVLSQEENRRRSILYQASRNNSFTGTPHYMAPETIQTKGTRGTAADLWSFGVVLYQLETGELPFQHESPYAVMNEVVEYKMDITKVKDLTARDLILKLLIQDPKFRLGVIEYDHNNIKFETIEQQKDYITKAKIAANITTKTEEDDMYTQEYDPLTQKRKPKLLSATTVYSTQHGYNSIKNHPYFTTFFTNIPDTFIEPPTPIVEDPNVINSIKQKEEADVYDSNVKKFKWNCDLPSTFLPPCRHARQICYNYISYTDQDGNPAEHPKQTKTKQKQKDEKEEIEKLEKLLEAEFPKVQGSLITPEEDDVLDKKLAQERKFADEQKRDKDLGVVNEAEQSDDDNANYSDDDTVNDIINNRWNGPTDTPNPLAGKDVEDMD